MDLLQNFFFLSFYSNGAVICINYTWLTLAHKNKKQFSKSESFLNYCPSFIVVGVQVHWFFFFPPKGISRYTAEYQDILKPQNFTDVVGLWIYLGCILTHLCLTKAFKVFEAPNHSWSKDPHVKNTVNNVTFPCQDDHDICGLGPYYIREQYN